MARVQDNKRRIARGFKWLRSRETAIAESGMKRLLEDCLKYAIDVHDFEHFGHRSTANSYAWGLLNGNNLVAWGVNEGHHGHGDAESQLRSVAGGMSVDGWAGIVLADMTALRDDNRPIAFNEGYEMGVLFFTLDEVLERFPAYFKA